LYGLASSVQTEDAGVISRGGIGLEGREKLRGNYI